MVTFKDLAILTGASEETIKKIHQDILKGGDEEYRQKLWEIINDKKQK